MMVRHSVDFPLYERRWLSTCSAVIDLPLLLFGFLWSMLLYLGDITCRVVAVSTHELLYLICVLRRIEHQLSFGVSRRMQTV